MNALLLCLCAAPRPDLVGISFEPGVEGAFVEELCLKPWARLPKSHLPTDGEPRHGRIAVEPKSRRALVYLRTSRQSVVYTQDHSGAAWKRAFVGARNTSSAVWMSSDTFTLSDSDQRWLFRRQPDGSYAQTRDNSAEMLPAVAYAQLARRLVKKHDIVRSTLGGNASEELHQVSNTEGEVIISRDARLFIASGLQRGEFSTSVTRVMLCREETGYKLESIGSFAGGVTAKLDGPYVMVAYAERGPRLVSVYRLASRKWLSPLRAYELAAR